MEQFAIEDSNTQKDQIFLKGVLGTKPPWSGFFGVFD